jgi:hypothetical protein
MVRQAHHERDEAHHEQAHHERDEEAHHERRQQSRLGLGGADFRVADLKLSARIEPFPFMVRQAHHERDEEAHHERDEEAHHERNLETQPSPNDGNKAALAWGFRFPRGSFETICDD